MGPSEQRPVVHAEGADAPQLGVEEARGHEAPPVRSKVMLPGTCGSFGS